MTLLPSTPLNTPRERSETAKDKVRALMDAPKLPQQNSTEHHALEDARWNREAWQFLADRARNAPDGGEVEGPDGPEGSVHWITRLSASEITALRDFLNGAPRRPTASPASGVGVEAELALKEATALAVSLFNQHYRDDEEYTSGRVKWEPLPDLRGVISQIDNMTAGLSRASPEQGEVVRLIDERLSSLDAMTAGYDRPRDEIEIRRQCLTELRAALAKIGGAK